MVKTSSSSKNKSKRSSAYTSVKEEMYLVFRGFVFACETLKHFTRHSIRRKRVSVYTQHDATLHAKKRDDDDDDDAFR